MIPASFPTTLLDQIENDFPNLIEKITTGWSMPMQGSFRVNTLCYSEKIIENILPENIASELSEKNIEVSYANIPFAWSFDAKDMFAIKGTKAFYEGKIYLQSLSSMLPAFAFENLDPQSTVLDMCAAPGGKTLQLAQRMENKGSIIALEKNSIRLNILRHNIALQQAKNIRALKKDALLYLQENTTLFSHILLDAPCSAEGRMKFFNEKSYGFWKPEIVSKNANLQKDLLENALRHLAPHGELVYSTCTINKTENEDQIQHILQNNPDITLCALPSWLYTMPNSIKTQDHALRILPSNMTEGFFIAKLKRL